MGSNRLETEHPHSHTELCEAGRDLYTTALKSGRVSRVAAENVPCLLDLDLLYPDPDDDRCMRPVPPSSVLAQLIQPIEREIQQRRRLAVALTDTFEPFMALATQDASATHAITVLEGLGRINASLDRATAECSEELLTAQPGSGRKPHLLEDALRRIEPLIARNVRMRTLYQHTARHHPSTQAYVERVTPYGVGVRTLEELIERLIIIDRKVAFIPARSDRQIALELRHPALVEYLVGVYEQFWRQAVPWDKEVQYQPVVDGITGVQRAIAKLLVEGHVDEAIARRLGMNVRTCRAHIAKLAAALGSGSRAQLGYLIACSGVLEQDTNEQDTNDA